MERCVGGGGHLVTVAGTCHSPVPTPGFVIVRNDQKYLVPYSPVLRTPRYVLIPINLPDPNFITQDSDPDLIFGRSDT